MTYPIDMPLSPKLSELAVLSESVTARSESPFTRNGQTVVWQGKRHRFTCTTPIMRRADAYKWQAFFASLNGREGTFLFQPSLFCLNVPDDMAPFIEIEPPAGGVLAGGTVGAESWTSTGTTGSASIAEIAAVTGRTVTWTGTAFRIVGHTSKITASGLPWTVIWDLGDGTETPSHWPRLNGQGNGGEIETDGWPPTLDGTPGDHVRAGQWITIAGRMYQVIEDGVAGAGGEMTIKIFPWLSAVADNTEIKFGEPATAAFRLDQDAPEFIWRTDKLSEAITFTIIPNDP